MATTRYGEQPAHGILSRRGYSVSAAARLINIPIKNLDNALRGTVLPFPVVLVRICALLDVQPEKAFTRAMLKQQTRLNVMPRWLTEGDFRPELDECWVEFLASMGWSPDDVRRGFRDARTRGIDPSR